jgi:hypothetical protein
VREDDGVLFSLQLPDALVEVEGRAARRGALGTRSER